MGGPLHWPPPPPPSGPLPEYEVVQMWPAGPPKPKPKTAVGNGGPHAAGAGDEDDDLDMDLDLDLDVSPVASAAAAAATGGGGGKAKKAKEKVTLTPDEKELYKQLWVVVARVLKGYVKKRVITEEEEKPLRKKLTYKVVNKCPSFARRGLELSVPN